MPEGAKLDKENHIVRIDPAHKEADAIQAPYSLNRCKFSLRIFEITSHLCKEPFKGN